MLAGQLPPRERLQVCRQCGIRLLQKRADPDLRFCVAIDAGARIGVLLRRRRGGEQRENERAEEQAFHEAMMGPARSGSSDITHALTSATIRPHPRTIVRLATCQEESCPTSFASKVCPRPIPTACAPFRTSR